MSESRLTPDIQLQRADDLTVRVGVDGRIRVSADGRSADAGSRGLALLDVFAEPRTLQEAVGRLGARGTQDWIDLTAAIRRLWNAGLLEEPGRGTSRTAARGFGAAAIHIAMLNDRARTTAYLEAIERTVRAGDVVVEIGTGTGVLAVAAARAGARRVFAIEANRRIAEVAREVFSANGVDDRVELLHGWSTEVDVPERGSVLVSETLGNRLLDERLLESFRDAAQRLLHPAARRIPDRVDLVVLPVEVPEEYVRRQVADAVHDELWSRWYGVDLSPLGTLGPSPDRPYVLQPPHKSGTWTRLAEPHCVATLPTDGTVIGGVEASVEVLATEAGELTGVMVCFEAELAPGISLGNVPGSCDDGCHWNTATWPVWPALRVQPGDTIAIVVRGGSTGFRVEAVVKARR